MSGEDRAGADVGGGTSCINPVRNSCRQKPVSETTCKDIISLNNNVVTEMWSVLLCGALWSNQHRHPVRYQISKGVVQDIYELKSVHTQLHVVLKEITYNTNHLCAQVLAGSNISCQHSEAFKKKKSCTHQILWPSQEFKTHCHFVFMILYFDSCLQMLCHKCWKL